MNSGDNMDGFERSECGLLLPKSLGDQMKARGKFIVQCHGPDGELQWEDEFPNLVTTVGANDLLDKYLAGSAYTAAFYMGLVDGGSTPTFNIADTMASHAGWTENVNYSQSARPTTAWSAASAKSKALSSGLAFTTNAASQVIAGCFISTVATKSGTTGILFSCGAFTGGNQTIASSGSTLTVSYSLSV